MIDDLVQKLRDGELVAAPTDTVFGVMADATNPDAIEKLYDLKARPSGKPFQVLVNSIDMAEGLAAFSHIAHRIVESYWPGALTLVLPLKKEAGVSPIVTGSLETIGLRWPKHSLIEAVIEKLGHPVAASSVNTAGEMPINDPDEIKAAFPHLTVAEGEALGTPSSVVELRDNQLVCYREGKVTRNDLERFLQ